MGSRLKLHEELCEVLGSRNCYFQPPESVKMVYPCIRYNLSNLDIQYANDNNYITSKRYEVMVIDKDPDSKIPERLIEHFQMIVSDRNYTADNLNHFVFYVYY